MISGINSSLSALGGLTKKAESTANNVANVNTPGYKATRLSLQDAGSSALATASGVDQLGRGVTVGSIDRSQSQGGLEATSRPTDFGISGQGYFVLRDSAAGAADLYSRVGNFQYDQEGYLISPGGALVQGWQFDPAGGERQGSIGDIRIAPAIAPQATTRISQVVNLDARTPGEDAAGSLDLFEAWDGRNAAAARPGEAIPADNYDYSSAITIYDSQGNQQAIDIYYDRTERPNQWEFLVTTDPLADKRPGVDPGRKGAGALMYGRIDFSTSGEIAAIEAYNVPPDGQVNPDLIDNRIKLTSGDSSYSFAANFTGSEENQRISLDLGAYYSGAARDFQPQERASRQYATSSTTISQGQDGYGAGFLQTVHTDADGVISATYSNGRVVEQAQVALANFSNPAGLRSDGGGIFRPSTASGPASTGVPGADGLGGLAANALESSNVDLTRELTTMLITQAGFKANVKMIQAGDEMIGSLLDIKT